MPRKLGPLTKKFSAAALGILPDAEYEVEFGRYCVDVLYRTSKLIVELDDRKTHCPWPRRSADAERDRYFLLRGYSTIRFTDDDLESPKVCVAQVREVLLARNRQWTPRSAIYIDWTFLHREHGLWSVKNRLGRLLPDDSPDLGSFLIVLWKRFKFAGDVDVFLFSQPGDLASGSIVHDFLHLFSFQEVYFAKYEWQYPKMVANELCEHMRKQRSQYQSVGLIADDRAYPGLLREVELTFLVALESQRTSMTVVEASNRWTADELIAAADAEDDERYSSSAL